MMRESNGGTRCFEEKGNFLQEKRLADTELLRLPEINNPQNSKIHKWETNWVLYGPVPNPGCSHSWPGEKGFSRLNADGLACIPDEIVIDHESYKARRVFSKDGLIDFVDYFNLPLAGCPIVFMLTELTTSQACTAGISFGVNWGTQWWLNGEEVFSNKGGNIGDPRNICSNQFMLKLKAGKNVICIKVIAGTYYNWNITLGLNSNYEPVPETLTQNADIAPLFKDSEPPDHYLNTGMRLERRPVPLQLGNIARIEMELAENGVQARWIGIIDHTGSPMAESAFLPPGEHYEAENEALIKKWVADIKVNGSKVLSWFPGMHSKSYAEKHPEHKSVSFNILNNLEIKDNFWESKFHLCHNSPYGEVLVNFLLESIEKYGLDGFWLDGTRLSHQDLGCLCKYCQEKYFRQTGRRLPEKEDWDSENFLQWINWRYLDFMDFFAELEQKIKGKFPDSVIAVNHLHRVELSWYSAIPLNRYRANVVASSESMDDPFLSAFHGRLQRAYKHNASEVWMSLRKLAADTSAWPPEMAPVNRHKHHAMATLTAGSHPVFGTPYDPELYLKQIHKIAEIINTRTRLQGTESIKFIGLHLSQQSETFCFSRNLGCHYPEKYWNSVIGWHHLFLENQFPVDIVFDNCLEDDLQKYPVFAAMNSAALSEKQIDLFNKYVENGGVLMIDRNFGRLDELGLQQKTPPPECFRTASEKATEQEILDDLSSETLAVKKHGKGCILIFHGNVGLAFLNNHDRALASKTGKLLEKLADPPLSVSCQNVENISVGTFSDENKIYLHLHNFTAYSNSLDFPNPVLRNPRPLENVAVCVKNCQAQTVKTPSGKASWHNTAKDVNINIPVLGLGTVIVIDLKR